MRYELEEDGQETRRRGESTLAFRVWPTKGEVFQPDAWAVVAAAEYSARQAWEAVDVYVWRGPVH